MVTHTEQVLTGALQPFALVAVRSSLQELAQNQEYIRGNPAGSENAYSVKEACFCAPLKQQHKMLNTNIIDGKIKAETVFVAYLVGHAIWEDRHVAPL